MMKKVIYILSLCIGMMFTACEVEEGDGSYYKTAQGYVAYSNVNNYTQSCIAVTEMLARVDLYATVPEDEKEGVKQYYLSGYQITQNGNQWTLIGKGNQWVFSHNGKSLGESGAIWTVTLSKNVEGVVQKVIEEGHFTLTTQANKDWVIKAENMRGVVNEMISGYSTMWDFHYTWDSPQAGYRFSSSLTLTANKAVERVPNLNNYTISKGEGHTTEHIDMQYIFTAPVLFDSGNNSDLLLLLTSGEMDITVNVKEDVKDHIAVEVKDQLVYITMDGITESYW